jgi:UDP-N-acetyl-2-amino-2-deoxyglucuronate dehydrogenase
MLNFGLVGCGHIARKHALALEQVEDARLTAVCDNAYDRAVSLGVQYGATPYADYSKFLTEAGIDAVVICTPSGLHAPMVQKAAQSGKHILVEKPFVLNVKEGKKLVELCQANGVKLGVVHPNRAKPIVQALLKAVSQGWFGTITHASAVLRWNRNPEYFRGSSWRGTKEMDGGILFNQAIHNIDLFNWLVGPVEEVFAYSATRMHKIQCEDVCICALKLANGALGLLEAAVTLYPENLEESIAIFGTQGTAILGGKSLSKILEWKFSCLEAEEAQVQAELLNSQQKGNGHQEVINDFVKAVLLNSVPMVSGEEALKVLQLIQAIYQSTETHLPVKVNLD